MSDERPAEKPTVKFEPPPGWAIDLGLGIEALKTAVGHVADDLGVVKGRIGVLEDWKREAQEQNARRSEGVRQISLNDSQQNDKLAETALEIAATKQAIKETRGLAELAVAGVKEVKENQAVAATERADTALVVKEVHASVSNFFTKHPALAVALVTLATTAAGALTALLSSHGGH